MIEVVVWTALALSILNLCGLAFAFIAVVRLRDVVLELMVTSLKIRKETNGRLDALEGKES